MDFEKHLFVEAGGSLPLKVFFEGFDQVGVAVQSRRFHGRALSWQMEG